MSRFENLLDEMDDRTYCLALRVLLENSGEAEYEACAARATNRVLKNLSALRKRKLVEYDAKADVWLPTDAGSDGPGADVITTTCARYSALRNLTEKLQKGA